VSARTVRGRTLETAYLNALQKKLLERASRNPTDAGAYMRRFNPATGRYETGVARSSTQPLVAATVAPQTSTVSNAMPSIANIIGNVANAVGGIFGNGATATAPTATNTFGSVANAVGSVVGAVFPGGPAVNTALAVGNLPGRASGGGMSEYLLERPTGSAGGAALTGLQRLGIPPGWTRKKVKALVRYVGPGQASAIIGAPLESVAIVAVSTHSRSRGISARDLRVTKRVTRRVLGIARDLACIRPPAPRRSLKRCN